jgi:hypothetical protein
VESAEIASGSGVADSYVGEFGAAVFVLLPLQIGGVAGLGMVAGCGLWLLGLMAAGLTLLTLGGMKWLEKNISSDRFNGSEDDRA